MMMLGGVPISVTNPPRIEAKESGINVSAGLLALLAAACKSTGINRASVATLFITADNTAETPDMIPICAHRAREASIVLLAISSITPLLVRPRLTIRTSAMMTVAG